MNDSKAPILLKPPENENRIMAPLKRYVTVGGHDVKRRANIPITIDEVDATQPARPMKNLSIFPS